MPRSKGSRNLTNYKYTVDNGNELKYFICQKDIEKFYDLKRTAIYFMLNQPEKRKDHKGLKINKLEEPLPVYKIIRNVDIEDNFYIKYEKMEY